ncbi:MAG TPA: CoA-binding protein [bacterium]|jgi:predicted CoA-binding protein
MTTEQSIRDFLAQKRIAVVGASRKPGSFSHKLFHDLWKHGYDAVPVNPGTSNYDDLPCAARVQDIVPPVGAALVMTSDRHTGQAVRDCAAAGISRVWIHLGAGKTPLSPEDIEFCRDNGIRVITGYCPYMFLPDSGFPHNFHGWIARLGKDYKAEKV